MLPVEILQEFNSCYLKIQAIAQNENWLLLIADKKIDPPSNSLSRCSALLG
ncbi:hypothetical protein COO91_10579 (plasmid) [Nostoc flagelliforme CCNUN1]|uniref:Uncharacterized protein n=2 Tax=Nostoc flagelliforme TaxID=1306274 RepID=A0A2K8T9I1_9NOSO|nr:hypothetical protein COO91_10579 [Nostoc flagelliforme CCNUN1]